MPNPNPLYEAAEKGDVEAVKKLLSEGAGPNEVSNGWTPLLVAVKKQHLEVVKALLSHPTTDINQASTEATPWTPLYYAAARNNLEITKALLEHPNIEVDKTVMGSTPLQLIVSKDMGECAKLLLEKGADPNISPSILLSVKQDNIDMVRLLVEHHVDPFFLTGELPPAKKNDPSEIIKLISTYHSQSWFIQRMMLLYPGATPAGVCHGVASMAVSAALLGQLDKFNDRLNLIKEIPAEEFVDKVQIVEAKRLKIINDLQATLPEKSAWLDLDEQAVKLQSLQNDFTQQFKVWQSKMQDEEKGTLVEAPSIRLLNELYAHLTIAEKDNPSKLAQTFQNQINTQIKDIRTQQQKLLPIIQQKIEEKLQSELTNEEKLFVDTKAWCDGIAFYQNIEAARVAKPALDYNLEELQNQLNITTPVELDAIGGIHCIAAFSGLYSREEMQTYFRTLQETIGTAKGASSSVVASPPLLLGASYHSIMVQYRPDLDAWELTDINYRGKKGEPLTQTISNEAIADKVAGAFFSRNKEDVLVMTTLAFSTGAMNAKLKPIIAQWRQIEVMENMHKVTPKKAQQKDLKGYTWLERATFINDADSIEALHSHISFWKRSPSAVKGYLLGLAGLTAAGITTTALTLSGVIDAGWIGNMLAIDSALVGGISSVGSYFYIKHVEKKEVEKMKDKQLPFTGNSTNNVFAKLGAKKSHESQPVNDPIYSSQGQHTPNLFKKATTPQLTQHQSTQEVSASMSRKQP